MGQCDGRLSYVSFSANDATAAVGVFTVCLEGAAGITSLVDLIVFGRSNMHEFMCDVGHVGYMHHVPRYGP
jgi:hypothetical protein